MPDILSGNAFPILRKVCFINIGVSPGTTIHLEVNCEGLPHFAEPIIHFKNGALKACAIPSTLHPSHIPGIDGQADDVLERHGGAAALARKISPLVETEATLTIERSFGYVELRLSVNGSHDLSATLPFTTFVRLLEPNVTTPVETADPPKAAVRPKKERKIPKPAPSATRLTDKGNAGAKPRRRMPVGY